jgi:hypothetical protein
MQQQDTGAPRRPVLGLSYGTRAAAKPQACASPNLTTYELRRLVAEMVD